MESFNTVCLIARVVVVVAIAVVCQRCPQGFSLSASVISSLGVGQLDRSLCGCATKRSPRYLSGLQAQLVALVSYFANRTSLSNWLVPLPSMALILGVALKCSSPSFCLKRAVCDSLWLL